MKRKVNRAANFHALVSLATKCTATIGGGVGLILVGLAGFDAKTPVTEDVAQTFQYVALLLPPVILLVAAGLAVGFPLDRAKHEIVRRRIEDGGNHFSTVCYRRARAESLNRRPRHGDQSFQYGRSTHGSVLADFSFP